MGLISQRKFDRHVPWIAAAAAACEKTFSEEQNDNDSDKENETGRELIDGEEVYLVKDNFQIFKAKFQSPNFYVISRGIRVYQIYFLLTISRGIIKKF